MEDIRHKLEQVLDGFSFSREERETLVSSILPLLEEKQQRMDFLYARTLKDKSIAINLLNQAVEDLQEKQKQIEEVNQTLIDQKKQLELQSRQLRESLDRLEMSYEELEQFAYIASHDLKSPLRTIASYAQLLQRRYRGQIEQDADEFLDFIVSGARHMNDIIGDLLEYSFIRKQKEVLHPLNLNEILELVKFNLQIDIESSGAQIEISPLPDHFRASKSGMVQLFQNLLSNAIKFRGDQPPCIRISAERLADHWQFAVQDNGIGLEQSYQEKVFLPFQRLGRRDLPGSGIGLAICKKVVKLHRGEIWYESGAGEGTRFYFTIPV